MVCWLLFAMVEQRPFTLQGAVVEALVERSRLHFVHGNIKQVANERVFENLDAGPLPSVNCSIFSPTVASTM